MHGAVCMLRREPVEGELRCVWGGVQGALCTSWMRFKHIEPHRTFSNCILTDDIFTGARRSAGCLLHELDEVQAQ